ncbi:MAG: hypothetical protein Q9180_005318, partial [Flavoplaca navasiana]
MVDPRLPIYLEALLDSNRIDIVHVLVAITQYANPSHLDSASLDAVDTVQSRVLRLMTKRIANGTVHSDTVLLTFLSELRPWMSQHPESATLGLLLSATLSSPATQHAITGAASRKFKASFGRDLTPLISSLSSSNIQLASALSYYQKQYDLQDGDVLDGSLNILNGVDMAALSFQDTVMDNEPIITRAGLYVYLNAMHLDIALFKPKKSENVAGKDGTDTPQITDRPLFDDMTVMNFLNARYKGNLPVLVTDIIVAAFDILANAMYRTEPQRTITILRSFLVNKLPAFLGNYTAITFAPLSIETCIGQALLRIDPHAFPSLSQMFDFSSKSSSVSEARQEFLFSCALHSLIPEGSIEVLLGDVPMQSLPASGRYMKADLVAECTSNPAKIEDLIGELENMEGNAGEIAGALFEIISTLCSNNDTLTLKGICNCLVRKSTALDSVVLFCSPQTLLQPLCHLLDNWEGHEDQGTFDHVPATCMLTCTVENQPVYDEFGSVLLLVSTIKHRFELQPSDLTGLDPDSFTSRYFRSASESRTIEQLSEHENELLGGWIRGLFEAEGINDELMSTCKPAEFHLLIATLFDQSIKACQTRTLTMETLKGGFEYLLETFLLPSLLAALTWLANTLWLTTSTSPQTDTLLPALSTLIKPNSLPPDSTTPHSAVLSLLASTLTSSLTHTQQQQPTRPDIAPLLAVLKPHLPSHNHNFTELESWTRTQPDGLASTMTNMVQGLLSWSFASPPSYTHRIIHSSISLLGASSTLDTLLNILTAQTSLHGPNSTELDTALDIIVAIIVAPLPFTPLLSLPSALRLRIDTVNQLAKKDAVRATIIVRLHRRVESVLAAVGASGGNNEGLDLGAGGNGGLNMSTNAAAFEGMDMNISMNMGPSSGQSMMLRDERGMPTTDIDDVLAETEGQIASGDFMG